MDDTRNVNLNDARRVALQRVDQAERNYRLGLFGAVLFETLFFVAFLTLADLHNRLHLLLLVSSVSIYSIVGLGMFALGAHVSRSNRLVMRMIAMGPGFSEPMKND